MTTSSSSFDDQYAVASSNTIEITGLTLNDVVRDDAVVTATVTDWGDVALAGQAWPVTLPSSAPGTGDYAVTLPPAVAFAAHARYKTRLTIAVGGVTLALERTGLGVQLTGA